MEKTKVYGFKFGFVKPKEEHRAKKDPIVFFEELEEYNQPIYIYDQYGWQDNCRMRNGRKIFPPFTAVQCLDRGDVCYISKYLIECSKIEELEEE